MAYVECGCCDVCSDKDSLGDCGQPVKINVAKGFCEFELNRTVEALRGGLLTVTDLVVSVYGHGLHVQTIDDHGITFVDGNQATFVK